MISFKLCWLRVAYTHFGEADTQAWRHNVTGTEIWATVPPCLAHPSRAVCERGAQAEGTVPEVTWVIQERRGGCLGKRGLGASFSPLVECRHSSRHRGQFLDIDFCLGRYCVVRNAEILQASVSTNGTGEWTQLACGRYWPVSDTEVHSSTWPL